VPDGQQVDRSVALPHHYRFSDNDPDVDVGNSQRQRQLVNQSAAQEDIYLIKRHARPVL